MRFFTEKRFNIIDAVAVGYVSIFFYEQRFTEGMFVLLVLFAVKTLLEWITRK